MPWRRGLPDVIEEMRVEVWRIVTVVILSVGDFSEPF